MWVRWRSNNKPTLSQMKNAQLLMLNKDYVSPCLHLRSLPQLAYVTLTERLIAIWPLKPGSTCLKWATPVDHGLTGIITHSLATFAVGQTDLILSFCFRGHVDILRTEKTKTCESEGERTHWEALWSNHTASPKQPEEVGSHSFPFPSNLWRMLEW